MHINVSSGACVPWTCMFVGDVMMVLAFHLVLKQGLYRTHHCILQASWSMSFQWVSLFCLPSQWESVEVTDTCPLVSRFYVNVCYCIKLSKDSEDPNSAQNGFAVRSWKARRKVFFCGTYFSLNIFYSKMALK